MIWLFDFTIIKKSPTLFTGKYLGYYSMVVYFVSFGFSIVFYF